ncbi:hypothetical protein LAZ67_6004048 [Cordylochernes scorpioides]|uniref:Uncharacterized protein n=1 Tax=Cordylochernes scorpioides TaxID=51811 RepID=A0ABY6KL61_9ARAC|nr:hypothetical protein LAZ67_6004048 [Cordylochernes scorpioides]
MNMMESAKTWNITWRQNMSVRNITWRQNMSVRNITWRQNMSVRNITWRQNMSVRNITWRQNMSVRNITWRQNMSVRNITWRQNMSVRNITWRQNMSVRNTTWRQNMSVRNITWRQNMSVRNITWRQNMSVRNTTWRQNMSVRNITWRQNMSVRNITWRQNMSVRNITWRQNMSARNITWRQNMSVRTDPEWKDKIITGDETWVYGYDPETKRQSAEWRDSPQEGSIDGAPILQASQNPTASRSDAFAWRTWTLLVTSTERLETGQGPILVTLPLGHWVVKLSLPRRKCDPRLQKELCSLGARKSAAGDLPVRTKEASPEHLLELHVVQAMIIMAMIIMKMFEVEQQPQEHYMETEHVGKEHYMETEHVDKEHYMETEHVGKNMSVRNITWRQNMSVRNITWRQNMSVRNTTWRQNMSVRNITWRQNMSVRNIAWRQNMSVRNITWRQNMSVRIIRKSRFAERNSNSFEKKSKLCKSARRRPGCKFCRAGRPLSLSLAAIPTSNAAAQVRRNWADITEEVNPGAEEGFTLVQGRKRRRGSANSPTAAAPSSNPGGSRTIRRPQPSAGSVPRAQEIRVTRAHIAEARARQASSSEEHCVYIEHSPELEPFHYLRALDRMLGGTAGVIQITKVNGHQLLGLTNRSLAERLISEGLEVEGTLLRAFPFRKRAERITVGNLPFFVADSAVITALSPFGRVTSIAPKQMKAGPYVYVDGRRDVFITLHEGITIERLPTRLDINIKGQAWPAYLSSGIRCSRCHGQGHRRAICPLLAGLANNTRMAPPTTPAGVPPPTTSAPPQRSAAQPPAPAPSNLAMEVCSAPPMARAVLHPSAPRPSPPATPALPMEETPSAPPPVIPAPSLQVPKNPVDPRSATPRHPEPTPPARPDFAAPHGPPPIQETLGPAAPTQDVEMSIVEETTASSASSTRNATGDDLVAFIEGNPSVSFARTDALGLGREEVLDLLSSRTKAQRNGPLLSPPQCDALVGLIGQILDLKPGHTSNLYKVLGQVRAELTKTPAAAPTPPLPTPRPTGPTPPVPHEEQMTEEQEDVMIFKIFRKLKHMTCLRPLYDTGIDVSDLKDAILFTEDRASLMTKLSPALKGVLAEFLGAAIELARGYHHDNMSVRNITWRQNMSVRNTTWRQNMSVRNITWRQNMSVRNTTWRQNMSVRCISYNPNIAEPNSLQVRRICLEDMDSTGIVNRETGGRPGFQGPILVTLPLGHWVVKLSLPRRKCDPRLQKELCSLGARKSAAGDLPCTIYRTKEASPEHLLELHVVQAMIIMANLVAEIRPLEPAVDESGGGYIERASLFLRLEDDTARSDYPSLSDLGRSLRARRRSPYTFIDDDGNAISGAQLRLFLRELLSSRFAQGPSSEEAIADFLAEVTPLEFEELDQLFLADISPTR